VVSYDIGFIFVAMEKLIFKIICLLFHLIGLIPKKQGERIGSFLGRMFYALDKKHREVTMRNLAYAFDDMPRPEIKALSLKVFENMGKIFFEIAWSLRLGEKRLPKYFKIRGLEHLREAYGKGKGVFVLTAHFGNWELLSNISAMIRYPLNIVYRPLDFKAMDRFIADFRTRFDGKLIPKRRSAKGILKSLGRGEMVLMLMDQNTALHEGVFADFFGHRACTNKAMAVLALRTRAPVVPVFLIRGESGFTGHFLPEIPLIKTGDMTKDVELNTEAYNKVIESFIREYPDQWLWLHQRWKTRPYHPWPRKEAGD